MASRFDQKPLAFRIVILAVWIGAIIDIGDSRGIAATTEDVRAWGATGQLDSLFTALGDASPIVRNAAAEALSQMNEPSGRLVLNSLKGSIEAQNALATQKDFRVIAPLVAALQDLDGTVREAAAVTLGRIGDPISVSALLNLTKDRDEKVRKGTAWALGQLKDSRAVPALVGLLKDKGAGVREASASALGVLGDLGAVNSLIQALGDDSTVVRQAAAKSLETLEEPLGRLILDSLDGSNSAREALALRGGPRAVPPITAALKNWNADLREGAAWTLWHLRDPTATAALIEALRDRDARIRAASGWALTQIADPTSLPALLSAVEDSSPKVREAAIWAVGKIGNSDAVEPVLARLSDPDSGVRASAAWVTAGFNETRAIDPIFRLLGDHEPKVREAAAGALEKFQIQSGQQLIAALSGDQSAEDDITLAADRRIASALVRLLESEERDARLGAARILGALKYQPAVDMLLPLAGGFHLGDRVVATRAAIRIQADQGADLYKTLFSIAIRPASLFYLILWVGGVVFMVRMFRNKRLKSRS